MRDGAARRRRDHATHFMCVRFISFVAQSPSRREKKSLASKQTVGCPNKERMDAESLTQDLSLDEVAREVADFSGVDKLLWHSVDASSLLGLEVAEQADEISVWCALGGNIIPNVVGVGARERLAA